MYDGLNWLAMAKIVVYEVVETVDGVPNELGCGGELTDASKSLQIGTSAGIWLRT